MEKILNFEQGRLISISCISPVLAYITPTLDFMIALILMFALNIWAGMRADGISITRCKNFSFKKFKNALCELFLYLLIINIVYTIFVKLGDIKVGQVILKSLTYVFLWVYAQNTFRNLIIAYPRNVALRVVYHIIRLEFTRALPSYIQPIIKRLDDEFEKPKKKKKCNKE